MSTDNPKPLPRRHTMTPWITHAKYREHQLVEVVVRPASNPQREVFSDDDLEQKLIDLDRAARCVSACELLRTDRPDLEIEALLHDRKRLMDILAQHGFKRPSQPDIVIHPGSDEPCEHQSIIPGESESRHVITPEGKTQIGPTDI